MERHDHRTADKRRQPAEDFAARGDAAYSNPGRTPTSRRNPVDNRGFDQAAASKTMLADESHSSPGSTPVRAWLSGRADQYADDGVPIHTIRNRHLRRKRSSQ